MNPFIKCPVCNSRLHSEFGICSPCETRLMFGRIQVLSCKSKYDPAVTCRVVGGGDVPIEFLSEIEAASEATNRYEKLMEKCHGK